MLDLVDYDLPGRVGIPSLEPHHVDALWNTPNIPLNRVATRVLPALNQSLHQATGRVIDLQGDRLISCRFIIQADEIGGRIGSWKT